MFAQDPYNAISLLNSVDFIKQCLCSDSRLSWYFSPPTELTHFSAGITVTAIKRFGTCTENHNKACLKIWTTQGRFSANIYYILILTRNHTMRSLRGTLFSACIYVVTSWTYVYKREFLAFIITYLLTPWSRVLLEKLTGFKLVKKFPEFYRTRRFITAFTSAHHLSLSWANSIQSIFHPTSWKCALILSFHLRLGLPSGLFPTGFPTKTLYKFILFKYVLHAQPTSFFSILSPDEYWVRCTDHEAPHYEVFSTPLLPRPF
jgi:hypothetical protein